MIGEENKRKLKIEKLKQSLPGSFYPLLEFADKYGVEIPAYDFLYKNEDSISDLECNRAIRKYTESAQTNSKTESALMSDGAQSEHSIKKANKEVECYIFDKESGVVLHDSDGKRTTKKESNRIAAKNFRSRRKEYIHHLELENEQLRKKLRIAKDKEIQSKRKSNKAYQLKEQLLADSMQTLIELLSPINPVSGNIKELSSQLKGVLSRIISAEKQTNST